MQERINLNQWIEYYQENQGSFWAILRQKMRLMRYTLEYESELDDLMQGAIEIVIKNFKKRETIPEIFKYSIFSLAVQNAINTHIRQLNLFKGCPATGRPEAKEGESFNSS